MPTPDDKPFRIAIERLARAVQELAAAELSCISTARAMIIGAEDPLDLREPELVCARCGERRMWQIPSACHVCGSTVAE